MNRRDASIKIRDSLDFSSDTPQFEANLTLILTRMKKQILILGAIMAGWTDAFSQSITNADPTPGVYESVEATGSNTVTIGDGVTVTFSRARESSTMIQVGGDSTINYAFDTSTFRQEGGVAGNNFALDSATFIQSGGSSNANYSQGTGASFFQTGGTTRDNVLSDNGFFHQSGGTALATRAVADTPTLFLSGGDPGNVEIARGADLSIWAADFSSSTIAPDASGQATFLLSDLMDFDIGGGFVGVIFDLTWQDGTHQDFSVRFNSGSSFIQQTWTGTLNLYDTDIFEVGTTAPVNPVPEPRFFGLAALSLIGGFVIWRRRSRPTGPHV